MRRGLYATYKGKIYEAGTKGNDIVILRSRDSEDKKYGFTLYKNIIYTMKVSRIDVDELCSITTIAEYEGLSFEVLKEKDGSILISSMKGNYKKFEDIGMDKVDKGVYEMWIPKEDAMKIYEEKTVY